MSRQAWFKLRGCLQSMGSSIFGIILADFRLQITREISTIVYFPRNLNRKSAQKNPKIDRTLLCRHPLKLPPCHNSDFQVLWV